jgi:hypothetical protein
MATWQLGIAVPDLLVPRMYPCSAIIDQFGSICGATPTSMYRRLCLEETHTSDIWLCPIHAAMTVSQMTICKLCAQRGGINLVTIIRLTEPVRLL